MILAENLRLPGIAHGFFTRQGGVSEGIYATRNCGLGSRDEPARVLENRARTARELGTAPTHLLTVRQVHSARAVVVEAPRPAPAQAEEGDAIVTAVPGLAVAVLTADCVPVLFAEGEAKIVGAAHAGWRGALGGVLEATVRRMQELGADPRRIKAGVGPAISRTVYEVGKDFQQHFLQTDPAASGHFHTPSPGARPHFDLPGYVVARLKKLGISDVAHVDHCTYGNESLYFSYRRSVQRGEPDYGRQISAVMVR